MSTMYPKQSTSFRVKASRASAPFVVVFASFVVTGIFVWGDNGHDEHENAFDAIATPYSRSDISWEGAGNSLPAAATPNLEQVDVYLATGESRSVSARIDSEFESHQIANGGLNTRPSVRGRSEFLPSQALINTSYSDTSRLYADSSHSAVLENSRKGETVLDAASSGGVGLEEAFELAAIGPIDSVALRADGSTEISILGQKFVSASSASNINVGEYVFAGSTHDNSLDFLMPIGEDYLQGVSEIRVLGKVDEIRPEIAQFSIGETDFDYSYLLSDLPGFSLVPGELVEVSGNQHVAGGSILLGIHGSGIRTTSGLQGIHGSGIGTSLLQGIHGSGIGTSLLQGIHGSGIGTSLLQGIHGSGIGTSLLQGIHGSGIGTSLLQGIHGSGISQ